MADAESIVAGDRVILVIRPTGRDSSEYPLTVGKVYTVEGLEGSNVRFPCDDPDIGVVSVNRDRVRRVTPWEESTKGVWVCHCDGVKFAFVRVDGGRLWLGTAYFDGDECATRTVGRESGLVELYEVVRHLRDERLARRDDASEPAGDADA